MERRREGLGMIHGFEQSWDVLRPGGDHFQQKL